MGRAALAILVLGAVLAGCAGPGERAAGNVADSGPVRCELPRPQVCTMIYAPVCATLTDGDHREYASPCNACADDAVSGYVDGPCDDDTGAEP